MKRNLLLFFLCITSVSSFSQNVLVDVIDNYYPVNPFTNEFSVFLKDLINNPLLTDKTIHKKTDSTLFFLKAGYTIQNPFSFQSSRIEVILAESEMQFTDSVPAKDTILVYQLIGYTSNDLKAVKSEFTKFEREYGRKFHNSTSSEIINETKPEGSIHNYFLDLSPISPLSVSWGKLESNQNAFIVTVRFILKENQALIPYFEQSNK